MRNNGTKLFGFTVATVAVVGFVVYMATQVIGPAARDFRGPVAGPLGVGDVIFYVVAGLTIAGAAGVTLSRNILYSAVGLLTALLGAGALYVFLAADFVAVAQLLVYIGGVLVLVLFAVMLTNRITDVNVSNSSVGLLGGVLLFVAVAPVLLAVAVITPWKTVAPGAMTATTSLIGDGFLTRWLLPFEVASLVLLSTLIGAIVIARKEIKAEEA